MRPPPTSAASGQVSYIHRIDRNNVGDVFCAPYLYMGLKEGSVTDILEAKLDHAQEGIVIVGGGGLGRRSFSKQLAALATPERKYKLIAWGVGSDTVVDRAGGLLDPARKFDLYGPYFDQFDAVGIRSWSDKGQRFQWVPCVSAMHPLLDQYRERKPGKLVGHYLHKNQRLDTPKDSTTTNKGSDLEQKLAFIADHEYIVTNTYHGVYWATLLERKVLCLPFKSGLFSFRHKPAYIASPLPTEEDLHRAPVHAGSLEECRAANLGFLAELRTRFDI